MTDGTDLGGHVAGELTDGKDPRHLRPQPRPPCSPHPKPSTTTGPRSDTQPAQARSNRLREPAPATGGSGGAPRSEPYRVDPCQSVQRLRRPEALGQRSTRGASCNLPTALFVSATTSPRLPSGLPTTISSSTTSLQDAPKPPWPSSGGQRFRIAPAGLTFRRILPRWRPHYPRRSSLRTPGPLRSTSGNAR